MGQLLPWIDSEGPETVRLNQDAMQRIVARNVETGFRRDPECPGHTILDPQSSARIRDASISNHKLKTGSARRQPGSFPFEASRAERGVSRVMGETVL